MATKIRLPENFNSKKLLSVVKGEEASIPRTRALELLVDSKVRLKDKILFNLIKNETENPIIRHKSVLGLYTIKAEKSEIALLDSLKLVKNKHVESTIIQMLGRIGTAESLKHISKLRRGRSTYTKNQIDFATSLISYRHNLDGHELKFPSKRQLLKLSDRAKTQKMIIAKVNSSEKKIALSSLGKESFGIQLASNSLLKVDCKPNNFILALNKEFAGSQGLKQLAKRKGILGLYLLKSKETGLYSSAFIITSTPIDKNKSEILLKTTSGKTGYAGIAKHTRDSLEFSLQSVRIPGSVSVKFKGKLTNGKFSDMEAISDTVISVPRKVPNHYKF